MTQDLEDPNFGLKLPSYGLVLRAHQLEREPTTADVIVATQLKALPEKAHLCALLRG